MKARLMARYLSEQGHVAGVDLSSTGERTANQRLQVLPRVESDLEDDSDASDWATTSSLSDDEHSDCGDVSGGKDRPDWYSGEAKFRSSPLFHALNQQSIRVQWVSPSQAEAHLVRVVATPVSRMCTAAIASYQTMGTVAGVKSATPIAPDLVSRRDLRMSGYSHDYV